MKIVEYAVLGVLGYLAVFAGLFLVCFAFLGDLKTARILNFWAKPQMLVWLNSGEEFFQESTMLVSD